MHAVAAALWLARVDRIPAAALADYRAWLGAAEAERYARFARPARQHQFLVGRGLLRHALAHLLAVAPASIRLDERPGQAPALAMAGEAPGLSISHSGEWVACAVSAHTALGLDIEQRDASRDLLALAEMAFDADTHSALAALSPAERVPQFYQRWSKQEARVKLDQPEGSSPAYTEVPHADCAIVICSAHPLTVSVHTMEGS